MLQFTLAEAASDSVGTVLVPISRAYGSFGTVTIDWHLVEPSAGDDLAPLEGTVIFSPGMTSADIVLSVLPDGVSSLVGGNSYCLSFCGQKVVWIGEVESWRNHIQEG